MATETPRIDERSQEEIAAQTEALAVVYTRPQAGDPAGLRGWTPPSGGKPDLGSSLIRLFSRMVIQVVDRLNQVPEKNHLAFLNLLGARRLPPRAARAPLTFTPAAAATREVIVPAGTKAGAAADGPLLEAVFETERDLVLTRARLATVLVRDPLEDRYNDRTARATGAEPGGYTVFQGDQAVDHSLYLACDSLFTMDGLEALAVTLTSRTLVDWSTLPLTWSWWDGAAWQPLDRSPSWQVWTEAGWAGRTGQPRLEGLSILCPGDPDTGDLLASQIRVTPGRAYDLFDRECVLHEAKVIDLAPVAIELEEAGIDARLLLVLLAYGEAEPLIQVVAEADASLYPTDGWMRLARLEISRSSRGGAVVHAVDRSLTDHVLTLALPTPPPLAPLELAGITARWLRATFTGLVPADPVKPIFLPSGLTARATAEVSRAGLPVAQAFSNTTPLDLGKDFTPLGLRPAFNDTLYLASPEAFSKPGAQVTLHVTLTDDQPAGAASADLKIAFEVWNGRSWIEVGRTSPLGPLAAPGSPVPATGFADGTNAFTKSSSITFTLPPQLAATEVEGRRNHWIRARVVAGRYGSDATYNTTTAAWTDPVVQPPWLKAIEIDYTATLSGDMDHCLIDHGGQRTDCAAACRKGGPGISPMEAPTDHRPALYLGFDQPLENRAVSLYLEAWAPLPHEVATEEIGAGPQAATPVVVWEYRGPRGWTPLAIEDETRAFTASGLVRFVAPAGMQASSELGIQRYWLRARWDQGEFRAPPRLGRIVPNTTWGANTSTQTGEVLGSSDGKPSQRFQLSQAPVLHGERIEVQEAEMPDPAELAGLETPGGPPALTLEPDTTGQSTRIWVRWRSMPDFYSSGPDDRHYVIDAETGEVRFGDGIRGAIPPLGRENVRAAWYQSGGGSHGDRPAGAINQLKSTIPFVEAVVNPVASSGGADLEAVDRVKERSAKSLRHRGRAVTVQDFEDLALDASPDIARSRAIPPLFDPVQLNDGARIDEAQGVGTVLVMIVPYSGEKTPAPGLELIRQVEEFLRPRCAPALRFRVSGPLWAEVRVRARLAPVTPELGHIILERAQALLDEWLHPLTGGPDGTGWPFGRRPFDSDLYRLLARIEGLDHIESLSIDCPAIPEDPNTLTEEVRRTVPWHLIYSGTHTLELAGTEREG